MHWHNYRSAWWPSGNSSTRGTTDTATEGNMTTGTTEGLAIWFVVATTLLGAGLHLVVIIYD